MSAFPVTATEARGLRPPHSAFRHPHPGSTRDSTMETHTPQPWIAILWIASAPSLHAASPQRIPLE